MAEVYLARPPESSDESDFARPVAIKKILPQFSHNERFIDMLKDEAKITVSLTHPNIAQVFELGLDGEDYFIVMEYVQGRPLNKLMQRVDEEGLASIPVAHAVSIMAEVAKGLDHAHRQTDGRGQNRNIVHRDVSPQNVLIAYTGDVKLIDFGIARAEGRVNQTHQGVIKGKLRYLAPEIASGREPDHRADIYCCGIVLFEMLTGEAMFAPRSDIEAIELATQAKVKSPRSRNRRVPEALDNIVMRALKKDRDQRIQTAFELQIELERFLRTHDPSYGNGALAAFMRTLFRSEIVTERSLNAAAVALVEDEAQPVVEDPTVTEAKVKRYSDPQPVPRVEPVDAEAVSVEGILVQELEGAMDDATRARVPVDEATLEGGGLVRVGGADGGEAMVVVPADASGSVPPPRSPYTQPPAGRDKMPPAGRDATPPGAGQRTATFVHFGTAGGQASDPVATSSFGPGETDRGDSGVDPVPLPRVDMTDQFSAGGDAGLGSWLAWFAKVALAAVLVGATAGAGAWLATPSASVPETPAQPVDLSPTPIELEPIPVPPPSVLTLMIEPDVPVTVRIDGKLRHQGSGPVVVPNVAPERVHRIRVSAEGYRPLTLSRVLKAGEQRTIELTLTRATGIVRLVNAVGLVQTSAGRVEGDRIVDVPLNSRLTISVARPHAKPFRRELNIRSAQEVTVVVPAPKPRPRGTLMITSRPTSSVVYVDGKKRGRTPLKLRLRAGSHRIVLESATGKTLSVTRTVRAGKTTTFVYRWPE